MNLLSSSSASSCFFFFGIFFCGFEVQLVVSSCSCLYLKEADFLWNPKFNTFCWSLARWMCWILNLKSLRWSCCTRRILSSNCKLNVAKMIHTPLYHSYLLHKILSISILIYECLHFILMFCVSADCRFLVHMKKKIELMCFKVVEQER